MNNDRLEALLWARIDGTIEPEELAELEAHLAEHPEPREIERQITTIAEELDGLEKVQPPRELRRRIDGALATANPPTAHPAEAPPTRSTPAWPLRWLPLAASLLIGVTVGYLVHPGTGGTIDRAGVTGSMLTPITNPEAAPVEISLEGGAVSVVASRAGSDVSIHVILETEIDLRLTLAGVEGPVHFTGLGGDQSLTEVTTPEQKSIALRTIGPGSLTLAARAANPDDILRIQVSIDGIPIEERWIGPTRNEIE